MSFRKRARASCAAIVLVAGTAATAHAAEYSVDPTHTYVTWEAQHFGTSTNRGRFDKKDGKVSFDAKAKTGKVSLTIDMNSISTGYEMFNGHLRGENFFNAATFPTAKFEADRFVFVGDKVSEVAGRLTLMGKTQPMTLKAANFNCYENPMLKREICGGDFSGTLKRSLFGMNYGLPAIPDDIRLVIQVEAIKH